MTTPTKKRHALIAIRKAHPGVSAQAQRERLHTAMQQGPVSTFEAMRYLDTYCPTKRIAEMRRDGLHIETVTQITVTESGERHRIGQYVLMPGVKTPP